MFENIEGVVTIGGDLYVKTPEALETLLKELHETDYEVDDLRAWHQEKRFTVEMAEKNGWALWHVHLARQGKCGSCGGLISPHDIETHGHTCELCGAVTFLKITDGSRVQFSFKGEEELRNNISMKAQRWDTESGYLYLYPGMLNGADLLGEQAKDYFERNSDKWEKVSENGQELVRVRYPRLFDCDAATVEVFRIHTHYWNHRIVQVWEDEEYGEYTTNCPVPRSMGIFETWHWAPLNPSPTLHDRVLGAIHFVADHVADKVWHLRHGSLGSSGFNRENFLEMGKFIRHFTTLDADSWDERSRQFRLDGSGGVYDIAHFCQERDTG